MFAWELRAGGLCSLHYGQNKPRLITTSDPESRGGKKVEIYGMKPVSDKFEIMSLKFPSRKFSQEDSGLLLSHPKIFWAQGHLAQPAAWYRLGESPCAQVKAFSKILFVNCFMLFFYDLMMYAFAKFFVCKNIKASHWKSKIAAAFSKYIEGVCLSFLRRILKSPEPSSCSPTVWVAPLSRSMAHALQTTTINEWMNEWMSKI